MAPSAPRAPSPPPDRLKEAEQALRRLGFARVAPARAETPLPPEFWVQEAGVPRRRFPVYVEPSPGAGAWTARPARAGRPRRAIVVVTNDQSAEAAWQRLWGDPEGPLDADLSILVLPTRPGADTAHWHTGVLEREALLRLATGIVVGLFRRAAGPRGEGTGSVDFSDLLGILRERFRVDVHRSLGVGDDEDALFLLYQAAQRFSWAPGDGGANLHTLVLKPTGPAARLPWFAA